MHELILGGQRSGKSRRAEARAAQWLAQSPAHEAVLIATALPADDEMRERIARHRADRQARVPRLQTVEAPLDLAGALCAHTAAHRLLVVDCLTLWLTNLLMPAAASAATEPQVRNAADALLAALQAAAGPVVLVSNEIGLGISPLGREVRHFVDELGRLHQAVAHACGHVTLMVAGQALAIKPARE